VKLEYF